ncbi:MAG TPA: hypothetical protein VIZ90_14335 [Rhizobiaceae bacterium]
MYTPFSRFRGEDDLEARLAYLTKEMASVKKAISRRGADAYDGARDTAADLYSDLRDRFSEALPVVSRRARDVGEVARHHPATAAVVGIVVVGLLATLFARGGSDEVSRRSRR